MKRMKKLMALVIAVAMVLAMGVVAFAADGDGHTISVQDEDTHTYRVFQVLTGTLAEAGSKQLGNAAWGADAITNPGNVDDFVDAITAEGLSEQDIAQLVAEKVNTAGAGRGTVSKGSPLSGLATGYYVLVDVTEITAADGKVDTKALHVVQVLNDINGIEIKYGTTEDKKKITGDTLGDATAEDPRTPDAPDTDNVSIGDTVLFQITASIPENANLYNYFYFVINDTLDPGLTLNSNSIAVYKDSVSDDNKLAVTTDYLVKTGTDAEPKSFQVGLVNAKSLAGKDIIVTYSAVLNENATIGEVPNKNTSTVTFSNDPNHDYNGQNNPGFPDSTDLKVTGETPTTTTETYTTAIQIQKVDEDGNVLTGAEFTITGESTEIVLVSNEVFTEVEGDEAFEYYGLNDGTYTKKEPVADSMKPAEAGATKGYVVDEEATGEDVITIDGVKYRPVREDDQGQIYVYVKGNVDKYNGKHYNKTVTYTQKNTQSGTTSVTAAVGADGVVTFRGLGAGTYTITESKTPEGYNTIDPITVNVNFTASPEGQNPHWSTTSEDASYNATTGTFELEIENKKGTELPTTGGIGTTIFYIVGAILVVGGGILLVSRRRMGSN